MTPELRDAVRLTAPANNRIRLNRVGRRALRFEARRINKRLATCLRTRARVLPESLRDGWHDQRAAPAISYVNELRARHWLGWLFNMIAEPDDIEVAA